MDSNPPIILAAWPGPKLNQETFQHDPGARFFWMVTPKFPKDMVGNRVLPHIAGDFPIISHFHSPKGMERCLQEEVRE